MARGLKDERHGHRHPADPDADRGDPGHDLSGRREPRPARPAQRPHPRRGLSAAQLLRAERVPAGDVQPVRRRAGRPQDRLHDRLEGGHRARRRRHGPDGPRRRRHARRAGRLAGPEPADGPGRRQEQGRATGSRAASGSAGRSWNWRSSQSAEAGAGRSGSSGPRAARTSWGCWSAPTGGRCRRNPSPATRRPAEQRYQPHHEVITSPDQVQVYETLLHDAKGSFTTSFVRGCETVKDNRLLPRGWRREGPGPALTGRFLQATLPRPGRRRRPPVRRRQRVRRGDLPHRAPGRRRPGTAPGPRDAVLPGHPAVLPAQPLRDGPRRPGDPPAPLLFSHLDLKGTPIEGWKLKITSAACGVDARTLREGRERRWPSQPSSSARTSSPSRVVVWPIKLTTTARLSRGRPRQFRVRWENIRCSILFHLLVPGGKWHTETGNPRRSASSWIATFQSRDRLLLLPPESAVIRSPSAPE